MKQTLPVLQSNSLHAPNTLAPAPHAHRELTRRDFIECSSVAIVAALLAEACGTAGDSITGSNQPVLPPPTGSVSYSGGVLVLRLALLPDLAVANGHQVIGVSDGSRRADVVVINASGAYKAFSSVCTHEGCTVSGFSGVRLICPCHGSEYDLDGNVAVGPAPRALRQYDVTVDAVAQTLILSV